MFCGRADEQVKVRGFRVEPGEVAAVLAGCPGVAQAAVVAREDTPGDIRLVGYLVPARDPGGLIDPGDADRDGLAAAAREHAAARLPGPHGALGGGGAGGAAADPQRETRQGRAARPGLRGGRGQAGSRRRWPRSCCARAFAEVLGVDRVGPDDDFFALGGHSLLAVRLASPGPGGAGGGAGGAGGVRGADPGRAGRGAGRGGPGPAAAGGAAAAGAGAVVVRAAAAVVHRPARRPVARSYNNPVALRLEGDLDVAALGAALGDVIGRHEVLRTVFPAADGQPYQRVLGTDELDWELPVTEVAEQDLPAVVAQVGGGAVRPGGGASPVRVRLLAVAPELHVLVLVIHHIATDGWSTGILARDLSHGVRGAAGGPGAGLGAAAGAVRGLRDLAAGAARRLRMIRAVCWHGRSRGGGRRWRGRRESWRCRPTGRARPSPSHRGHTVPVSVPARGACRRWPRWRGSRA